MFIGLEQQLSSGMTKANRQAPHQPATPPWLWLLLISSLLLIFWKFVPKREGPNPPPAPTFRTWLLLWPPLDATRALG